MKRIFVFTLVLFSTTIFANDISKKISGLWEIQNYPKEPSTKYFIIINQTNEIVFKKVNTDDFSTTDYRSGIYKTVRIDGQQYLLCENLITDQNPYESNKKTWSLLKLEFPNINTIKFTGIYYGMISKLNPDENVLFLEYKSAPTTTILQFPEEVTIAILKKR